MKKVLLIGGTGAIGMYLAPYLLKEGFKVYITSRSDRSSDNDNIEYLKGNGKDIQWLMKVAAENEFVAVIDFMMYNYQELEERYKELLSLSNQYIYLSSYRALASDKDFLKDDSPRKVDLANIDSTLGEDKYGMTKGQQENLFLSSNNKNWTIVRPSMTFSKNRFQFGAMDNWDIFRTVRGAATVLPKGLWDTPATLVYGKDVALMISKLVANDEALGETFNVVTKEYKNWSELSCMFNRVFGLMVSKIISDDEYINLTGQGRTMIDRLLPRKFDNTKLLEVTGLKESDFHSLEEGLKEAWKESDRNRFYFGPTNWKAQANFDFVSQSLLNINDISKENKKIYSDEFNGLYKKNVKVLWQPRRIEDTILYRRVGEHILYNIDKEEKYEIISFKKLLKKGKKYKLKFTIYSDEPGNKRVFLRNVFNETHEIYNVNIVENRGTAVEVIFLNDLNYTNSIAFSAEDFKISNKSFSIEDFSINLINDSNKNTNKYVRYIKRKIPKKIKKFLKR